MSIKEIFLETYYSKNFQILLDLTRIFLLIMAILIFIELVSNIETAKFLMNDPCRMCENKTGAVCFFYDEIGDNGVRIIEKRVPVFQDKNWSLNLSE